MDNGFIGNLDVKNAITEWLNTWYHKGYSGLPLYAILFGGTGNGKTLLPTLLAKMFGVELVRITPYDIGSMNDVHDFVKTINNMTLDGDAYKLILIDDIDELDSRYQVCLFEEANKSKFPIIFTSTSYSLPSGSIDKSLKRQTVDTKKNIKRMELLKIEKPLTMDLVDHIRKKAKDMNVVVSEDQLYDIAQKSLSVRSAEMSLYNFSINTTVNPLQTRREIIRSIGKRTLTEPINRSNIDSIFKAIKGYNKDAFRVKNQFANFDYRIRTKFEEIEPFFVNEMIEPIENVKLQYNYENKERVKESEHISIPKQEEEKKKEEVQPTLDRWGL